MDFAKISVGGKGHSAKIYLTKTFENLKKINIKFVHNFKNFTKFFRNKIHENLRNFQSLCENIKHCE